MLFLTLIGTWILHRDGMQQPNPIAEMRGCTAIECCWCRRGLQGYEVQNCRGSDRRYVFPNIVSWQIYSKSCQKTKNNIIWLLAQCLCFSKTYCVLIQVKRAVIPCAYQAYDCRLKCRESKQEDSGTLTIDYRPKIWTWRCSTLLSPVSSVRFVAFQIGNVKS